MPLKSSFFLVFNLVFNTRYCVQINPVFIGFFDALNIYAKKVLDLLGHSLLQKTLKIKAKTFRFEKNLPGFLS